MQVPATPAPPRARLMLERPQTLDVLAGRERFRCLDWECVLTRADCASRWKGAKTLKHGPHGITNPHDGTRSTFRAHLARCAGCPVGAIHAREERETRRHLRALPVAPPPARQELAAPVLVEISTSSSPTRPETDHREEQTTMVKPKVDPKSAKSAKSAKPAEPTGERQCAGCQAKFAPKGRGFRRYCDACQKQRPRAPRASSPRAPRASRASSSLLSAAELLRACGYRIVREQALPAGLLLVVGGK